MLTVLHSARLSVRLSHLRIVSKRLNLLETFFDQQVHHSSIDAQKHNKVAV